MQNLKLTTCWILFFVVFISCNYFNEKKYKVVFKEYRSNEPKTSNEYFYLKRQDGNHYYFTYNDVNSIGYEFISDFGTNCYLITPNIDTLLLKIKCTSTFSIGEQNLKVYNYLFTDEDAYDSSVNFFLSKEFGFICSINTASMYEIMIDSKENDTTNQLQLAVKKDTAFYFYGCKLPPAPSSGK